MLITLAVLAVAAVYVYRRYVPVPGLRMMNCSELHAARVERPDLKLVDVRDVSEFMANPKCDMINISLGRLPYVWDTVLKPGDDIVIVTPKRSDGFIAARKLRKAGFTSLAFLVEECTSCSSFKTPTLG
ncbi:MULTISPECIES: rhodanese-like domain-containing protein [Paenibacillus]|uniref:Rhodanese-like domain-containing protein n=1 Tax=Paenibacillus campinasensis TaxID=66347 RepID=A0A268EQ34_9BACL|nr:MULTISPECIES: rhodanese-like domain-containing protein [Paenibacillus]MUG66847.1 rhodanese-like domain-containing protein [Paenibacillus campinasensis]PAD75240.1 hypothetical protein CHH67_15320 [Paenibacillus campinasensis]PAK55862.1 hypothetical protein CHH75_00910 [Paenibacillus sp. 7541]